MKITMNKDKKKFIFQQKTISFIWKYYAAFDANLMSKARVRFPTFGRFG